MVFQLLNNIKFTLAAQLEPGDLNLVVLDSDLADASKYDPNKKLSLTLVGDEELNEYEIVYATSRTGTTFAITRGEEQTTAGSWPAGTQIIAALTAATLVETTSTTGDASDIDYGGGNFGPAGDMETVIDDMGDAIITLAAETDEFEFVQQRVGGGLFTGGAADTTNLRWQGSAKKFTTNGLGAVLTTTVVIATPTVPPDLVLAIRCADLSNFNTLTVVAFNNASPTNSMTWNVPAPQFPQNNAWLLYHCPAKDAVVAGTPSVTLPDRVRVEFKDDATGTLEMSINHLDVVKVRESYLGSFIRVTTDTDFNKVNTIAKYGFQVSLIIPIESLASLTQTRLAQAQLDGHRFYMTSTANFKAQTTEQIMVKLYTGQREAFNRGIPANGWVYQGNYNGPLDGDPNTTIRRLVSLVYPAAVLGRVYRSIIGVYIYDDPYYGVADLAAAQAHLTGADKRAANVDLSALSVSDLDNLYTGIVNSKNFYTTTLDYQNADNLKSGTVAVDRLPVVPPSKGGSGQQTIQDSARVIGAPIGCVLAYAGPNIPAGWVLCDGRQMHHLTYPLLFAMIGGYYGWDGTYFRVPNLYGKVIAQIDPGAQQISIMGTTLGAAGGSQVHYLTIAQLPSHNHTPGTGTGSANHAHSQQGTFNTDQEGDHSHTFSSYKSPVTQGELDSGNKVFTSDDGSQLVTQGTSGSGAHTHKVTISGATTGSGADHTHGVHYQGGGDWHPNIQPTMFMNYIIRAL
jgi:microcystin-dependent protein